MSQKTSPGRELKAANFELNLLLKSPIIVLNASQSKKFSGVFRPISNWFALSGLIVSIRAIQVCNLSNYLIKYSVRDGHPRNIITGSVLILISICIEATRYSILA